MNESNLTQTSRTMVADRATTIPYVGPAGPVPTASAEVLYGTLGLLIIKTLEALGPLHGYRIARRIEQISGDQLALNQGTLYPALLKLDQMGWISSKWGTSESGRRVRVYALTRAGRKQLQKEEAQWQRAASIVERFLKISEKPS
jgi:transcriptional regulator